MGSACNDALTGSTAVNVLMGHGDNDILVGGSRYPHRRVGCRHICFQHNGHFMIALTGTNHNLSALDFILWQAANDPGFLDYDTRGRPDVGFLPLRAPRPQDSRCEGRPRRAAYPKRERVQSLRLTRFPSDTDRQCRSMRTDA